MEKNNSSQKNYKHKRQQFQKEKKLNTAVTPTPKIEHVIIGQCYICGTGVSNTSFSLEYDSHVIHFECCLKKVKEIVLKEIPFFNKKHKITYLGSSTFAIYTEKGGSFQWNILKKITLKEMFSPQKEK